MREGSQFSPFPAGLFLEGMVSCRRLSSGAGGCHGGLVNSAAAGTGTQLASCMCLHQSGDRAPW